MIAYTSDGMVIFLDERLRTRATACLKTDMANVGHRRCRIGVIRINIKETEYVREC